MQAPKKPRACIPCHARKVRCNYAEVGTPCTRCVTKERTHECTLVAQLERNSIRRKHHHRTAARNGSVSTASEPAVPTGNDAIVVSPTTPMSLPGPLATAGLESGSGAAAALPALRTRGADRVRSERPVPEPVGAESESVAASASVSASASGLPIYSMSEDDAQLQTLCRMSENQAVDLSPDSTAADTLSTHRIVEYYSDLNAISVLGEALGQPRRRRLVQIDLPGPKAGTVVERELSRLDAVDRAYLLQRRVHDIPSKHVCDSLLQLFFLHVYPYTPIIDRAQFVTDYQLGNYSAFLLYSIFSITAPYASASTLQAAGFADAPEAQKEFFTRARLLYDFGCEKWQLNLLQGSIFMSSFQHSFAPDKDFRYWFANAVRIATQMGLHRQNLEEDLSPRIHRVCRRIWWLLYQRDFIFTLSGFINTRRLNDEEADTRLLELSDWAEDESYASGLPFLRPYTSIHMQFAIESCKLAQLGFRCLGLCRAVNDSWSVDEARQLGDGIRSWRSALPSELQMELVSDWNADNVWVLVIHAMSFRLACLFYRTSWKRRKEFNETESKWLHQQLIASMFELSTLLRRAMALDVIQYGPPSLIVTSMQLIALQIEAALSPSCTRSQQLSFKSEIHTLMQHLRATERNWPHAKWAYRALDGVVNGTGLALKETKLAYNDDSWTAGREQRANRVEARGLDTENPIDQHGHSYQPNFFAQQPQPWDNFPDNWLWDMMDAGVLGGWDHGEQETMDAPL